MNSSPPNHSRQDRFGSTIQLLELCTAYFLSYVGTGVAVKYFTGSSADGFPGLTNIAYLVYSTLGSSVLCLGYVFFRGWHRLQPGPIPIFLILSGVCTAVVIPTTTLMYTLPISVMVAMVIMRGSVIVISRGVDAILTAQGLLHKKVLWEENLAVGFALTAVGTHLFLASNGGNAFEFLESPVAVSILSSYIVAYALRIYIMNRFKTTRPKHQAGDNHYFFAMEQIVASLTLGVLAAGVFFLGPVIAPETAQVADFRAAFLNAPPAWGWATASGLMYGLVAFFSVFIFMFAGRTATFAGLVNRLTSLTAGTAATLLSWWWLGGRFPRLADWISLGLILIAVGLLTRAEKRRSTIRAS